MNINIKHLLLGILLCTFIGCADAQSPKVAWTDLPTASQSSQTQKLYFIDFYTSWCGWCKKMDAETFTDPTVAKILTKYYIPVKFDAESSVEFTWRGITYKGNASNSGRKAPHQFATSTLGKQIGYPTSALFKADKSLLTVVPGYMKPTEMVQLLWFFASGDYEKYSWNNYVKIFDKEIRPVMNKQLGIK